MSIKNENSKKINIETFFPTKNKKIIDQNFTFKRREHKMLLEHIH